MVKIQHQSKYVAECNNSRDINYADFLAALTAKLQIHDFYLVHNGKRLQEENFAEVQPEEVVHLVPRLPGGKGGFGSMLRAIGAQIEKTTNREACRDLSGRRLRDINEEKRLKAWIDKQAEREQEAEEQKRNKLEKLMRTPKVEFKDEVYEKERSSLPERLEDAVVQGLREVKAIELSKKTGRAQKRKMNADAGSSQTKKKTLWIEDGLDIPTSDEESDDSENSNSNESPKSSKVNAECVN